MHKLPVICLIATAIITIVSSETIHSKRVDIQYGTPYLINYDDKPRRSENYVEENEAYTSRSSDPLDGLLIIRLVPKSMLRGTILADYEKGGIEKRIRRSPGRCCGGGGGGGNGGGGGGGGGRGGGGGKAGAWSTSSSSAGSYGKGYGKG